MCVARLSSISIFFSVIVRAGHKFVWIFPFSDARESMGERLDRKGPGWFSKEIREMVWCWYGWKDLVWGNSVM